MHGNGDHYLVVRPGKHMAPLLADVNDWLLEPWRPRHSSRCHGNKIHLRLNVVNRIPPCVYL